MRSCKYDAWRRKLLYSKIQGGSRRLNDAPTEEPCNVWNRVGSEITDVAQLRSLPYPSPINDISLSGNIPIFSSCT